MDIGGKTPEPVPERPVDALGGKMLRQLLFGSGAGLAAGIAFYSYRLLMQRPDQAFHLLEQWGPSFLIALLAIYLFWDVVKQGVNSVARLAEGMQLLSLSVTKIAEKDDRQFEEMQRMSQYAARQTDRMVDLLVKQNSQLAEIETHLDALPCPRVLPVLEQEICKHD